MATTEQRRPRDLQELAKRHLWMHFTRMGAYADARGADHRARRGLLRLRRARQALPRRPRRAVLRRTSATAAPTSPRPAPTRRSELGFFTNWSYAHPRSIELAAQDRRARARRPQPRLLHQRRLRGGRVGAQARAPVPQAHGQPAQDKVIAREIAYHGTTMGALAATGIPSLRAPFEPLHARRLPRAEHEPLPPARGPTPRDSSPRRSASASCSRAPRPSPP